MSRACDQCWCGKMNDGLFNRKRVGTFPVSECIATCITKNGCKGIEHWSETLACFECLNATYTEKYNISIEGKNMPSVYTHSNSTN